jgi:hypothetical protein
MCPRMENKDIGRVWLSVLLPFWVMNCLGTAGERTLVNEEERDLVRNYSVPPPQRKCSTHGRTCASAVHV